MSRVDRLKQVNLFASTAVLFYLCFIHSIGREMLPAWIQIQLLHQLAEALLAHLNPIPHFFCFLGAREHFECICDWCLTCQQQQFGISTMASPAAVGYSSGRWFLTGSLICKAICNHITLKPTLIEVLLFFLMVLTKSSLTHRSRLMTASHWLFFCRRTTVWLCCLLKTTQNLHSEKYIEMEADAHWHCWLHCLTNWHPNAVPLIIYETFYFMLYSEIHVYYLSSLKWGQQNNVKVMNIHTIHTHTHRIYTKYSIFILEYFFTGNGWPSHSPKM